MNVNTYAYCDMEYAIANF